jgi:hypothetical protein
MLSCCTTVISTAILPSGSNLARPLTCLPAVSSCLPAVSSYLPATYQLPTSCLQRLLPACNILVFAAIKLPLDATAAHCGLHDGTSSSSAGQSVRATSACCTSTAKRTASCALHVVVGTFEKCKVMVGVGVPSVPAQDEVHYSAAELCAMLLSVPRVLRAACG